MLLLLEMEELLLLLEEELAEWRHSGKRQWTEWRFVSFGEMVLSFVMI